MAQDNPTVAEVVRLFASSLPAGSHANVQEAIRFGRWLGEDRKLSDIRPPDVEAYVASFGANAPNAAARADSLKGFLTFAHKKGLMPEKLVSHVRVRRANSRARGQAQPEEKPTLQLTSEGREALEKELEDLKARRPGIARDLRDAMADKDFRENAPLDAARDAQGQLEARIREIESMLRHAVVIQEATSDAARVGSTITLHNVASGGKLTYLLVSSAEAKPNAGRLSVASPIGQAVVGKRAGEEIEVQTPSGRVRFRLESVES